MDSITQVVLGAAVGEAVLGKKIGNRAMVWGGIAGTIPDLDVLANVFYGEIPALLIHRGFMHSLLFALLASPPLALFAEWFYSKKKLHQRKGWRIFAFVAGMILLGLFITVVNLITFRFSGGLNWPLLLISIGLISFLVYRGIKRYINTNQSDINVSWRSWMWLFLLGIGTHPVLDCFTTYGTQILLPFSNKAISFNSISVVDPFYTLPFLAFLLLAVFAKRKNLWRSRFNYLGIAISSLYLIFTIFNKSIVNKVFEQNWKNADVTYSRYMTAPTIMNNFLWYGIAESKNHFHTGQYSILDSAEVLRPTATLPKNHLLIAGQDENRDIRILKRFSKGYFNVLELGTDSLQFNDLRFGSILGTFEKPDDYTFRFNLLNKNGVWIGKQSERPDGENLSFRKFINRVKGKYDR